MSWHPDAHNDNPHYWLAVFGGHASIGLALWLACMWGGVWVAVFSASMLYAAFEAWQARQWSPLIWDSVLDWVGVTFGAMAGAFLWSHDWPGAAWCIASCLVIGFAGYETRKRRAA